MSNPSFKEWVQIQHPDDNTKNAIYKTVALLKKEKLTQRQAGVVLEGVKVLLMESPV